MKLRWRTITSNVSIRTISPTATPLPKAYDCVAVYIAGRRTNLVVYGWRRQPKRQHGTCVTHVLWCMMRSLTSGSFEVGSGENDFDIPGASTTQNSMYLTKKPWLPTLWSVSSATWVTTPSLLASYTPATYCVTSSTLFLSTTMIARWNANTNLPLKLAIFSSRSSWSLSHWRCLFLVLHFRTLPSTVMLLEDLAKLPLGFHFREPLIFAMYRLRSISDSRYLPFPSLHWAWRCVPCSEMSCDVLEKAIVLVA